MLITSIHPTNVLLDARAKDYVTPQPLTPTEEPTIAPSSTDIEDATNDPIITDNVVITDNEATNVVQLSDQPEVYKHNNVLSSNGLLSIDSLLDKMYAYHLPSIDSSSKLDYITDLNKDAIVILRLLHLVRFNIISIYGYRAFTNLYNDTLENFLAPKHFVPWTFSDIDSLFSKNCYYEYNNDSSLAILSTELIALFGINLYSHYTKVIYTKSNGSHSSYNIHNGHSVYMSISLEYFKVVISKYDILPTLTVNTQAVIKVVLDTANLNQYTPILNTMWSPVKSSLSNTPLLTANIGRHLNNVGTTKYSPNSPFISELSGIVSLNIDNHSKQIRIENSLLNSYDNLYYGINGNSSHNDTSVELHKVTRAYKSVSTYVNEVLDRHIKNSYSVLLSRLNNDSTTDDLWQHGSEAKGALVLLIIGTDVLLSNSIYTLSTLIGNGSVNRVTVCMEIGKRLVSQALLRLSHHQVKDAKGGIRVHRINSENTLPEDSVLLPYDQYIFPDYVDRVIKLSREDMVKHLTQSRDNEYLLSNLGVVVTNSLLKGTNPLLASHNVTTGKHVDKLISWSESFNTELQLRSISSAHFPMVSPPVTWNGDAYKPYYLNDSNMFFDYNMQVIRKRHDLIEQTQDSIVLKNTINFLNKQEFRVSKDVLSYCLDSYYDHDTNLFPDMPFDKPHNIAVMKANKAKYSNAFIEACVLQNQRFFKVFNTLSVSKVMGSHTFYLPTYADFRGRIYCVSSELSYQGGDLSRGLIRFANITKETTEDDFNWVLHHLANLLGYSKYDHQGKVSYGRNVYPGLLNKMLTSRAGFNHYIASLTSEPIQLISCLITIHEYLTNKSMGIPSYLDLPIQLDASCNGMQHLAALTHNVTHARELNFSTPYSEDPNNHDIGDLYKNVFSKEIKDKLPSQLNKAEALQNDNSDIDSISLNGRKLSKTMVKGVRINELRKINITRNLVKKLGMTIPYNVSKDGAINQFVDMWPSNWLEIGHDKVKNHTIDGKWTLDGNTIIISHKELVLFVTLLYNIIKYDNDLIKTVTTYLNGMSKLVNSINLPLTWITPMGLKVMQNYSKLESKTLTHNLIKGNKEGKTRIVIPISTGEVDNVKRAQSFMPNLIHSLDSTNIQLLVEGLVSDNSDINLYTIHDCFATTTSDALMVNRRVTDAFISIYFRDETYLETMHRHFIESIKSCYTIHTDVDNTQYIHEVDSDITSPRINIPNLPITVTDTSLRKYFFTMMKKATNFLS